MSQVASGQQNLASRNEYEDARWEQALGLLEAICRTAADDVVVTYRPDLEELIHLAKLGSVDESMAAEWDAEIRVLKLAGLWPTGK